MANTVFSACAATASAIVAVVAALQGLWVVTAVWALLAVGFVVRASERRGSPAGRPPRAGPGAAAARGDRSPAPSGGEQPARHLRPRPSPRRRRGPHG